MEILQATPVLRHSCAAGALQCEWDNKSSNESPAPTSDAARRGNDIAAQPSAGADGVADEAQPAYGGPHFPYGDRDHGTLFVEGVAAQRGGIAWAGLDVGRHTFRGGGAWSVGRRCGIPRGDPRR